jgi:hypothetical protein
LEGLARVTFAHTITNEQLQEAKDGVIRLETAEHPIPEGKAQGDEDFSLDYPELIDSMLVFIYTGKLLSERQGLALERCP